MSDSAVSESREDPRGKAAGKAVRRVFMGGLRGAGVELLAGYQQSCDHAKQGDVRR
jgi:hypothetical protein